MSDESAHWFIVSILHNLGSVCASVCLCVNVLCCYLLIFFPTFSLRVRNHTHSLAISLPLFPLSVDYPRSFYASIFPYALHYWKILNCNFSWHLKLNRKTEIVKRIVDWNVVIIFMWNLITIQSNFLWFVWSIWNRILKLST